MICEVALEFLFYFQGLCGRIHVWLMNSHQLLRWSNSWPCNVSPITVPASLADAPWISQSENLARTQLGSHMCNLIDTNCSWQSCDVLAFVSHLWSSDAFLTERHFKSGLTWQNILDDAVTLWQRLEVFWYPLNLSFFFEVTEKKTFLELNLHKV